MKKKNFVDEKKITMSFFHRQIFELFFIDKILSMKYVATEFFHQEDLDQLIDILVLSNLSLKELVISMGWHEVSLNHKRGIRDSELNKRPHFKSSLAFEFLVKAYSKNNQKSKSTSEIKCWL